MKDPKLLKAYNKIARRLESFLQGRAPVGETGTLKTGTTVSVTDAGIRIETYNYGMFLHLGTGIESSNLTYEQALTKSYNPNPGVGVGGIKPRFWMSFGQTLWTQILDEIAKEEGNALAQMIAAKLGSQMGMPQIVTVKLK
jgi:hypothetical protein